MSVKLDIALAKARLDYTFHVPEGVGQSMPAWKGKVHDLAIERFKSIICSPLAPTTSGQAFLSGGVASAGDVISDVRGKLSYYIQESPSAQLVGLTTAANIFQGGLVVHNTWNRFKAAHTIGDWRGRTEALTDMVRGGGQALGGLFYLPFRLIMVAVDVLPKSAPVLPALLTASQALVILGDIFFMVCSAAMTVWGGWSLGEDIYYDVKNNLTWKASEKTDIEWLEKITQKLTADSKEKLARLQQNEKTFGEKKEQWETVALDFFADQVMQLQDIEQTTKRVSREQAKELFKEIFEQRNDDLKGIRQQYLASMGFEGTNLSTLQLIGFQLEESKRQKRKEAKFARVTSGACLEAIKKAADSALLKRLESTNKAVRSLAEKEVVELKNTVWKASTITKIFHASIAIGGIIGIIFCATSFIPALATVCAITYLIYCMYMIVVDSYCAIEGMRTAPPGRHDKTYILVAIGLILGALAMSAGITFGCGLPIAPLIIALIWGQIALILSFAALCMAERNERKWKEDHLELEDFQKLLAQIQESNAAANKNVIIEMFKKLPKEDREAIYISYTAKEAGDSAQYTEFLFKAIFRLIGSNDTYFTENEKAKEFLESGANECLSYFFNQGDLENAARMENLIGALKENEIKNIRTALDPVSSNEKFKELLKEDFWLWSFQEGDLIKLKDAVATMPIKMVNQPKETNEVINEVINLFHPQELVK